MVQSEIKMKNRQKILALLQLRTLMNKFLTQKLFNPGGTIAIAKE
jgi:hypothetical protein